VNTQRLLRGFDAGPVDVVWSTDNSFRVILTILGLLIVYIFGGLALAATGDSNSALWNVVGSVVALVFAPCFVWIVGFRPKVAVASATCSS
jgi:hypothetical protein